MCEKAYKCYIDKMSENKGRTRKVRPFLRVRTQELCSELPSKESSATRQLGIGDVKDIQHTLHRRIEYRNGWCSSVRIFTAMTSECHLKSVGGGGIGALAVSHNKKFIAVAERSITESAPNIYVYEYPSLKIVRVLRNGTERSYSALAFNTSDTKLASVGAFPDFMLTVWDWEKEKIILRNKAFSQDVFKVSFFPEDDGILTTSGTGHIRFWKMAQTFTGMKLQGEIGKFGKFDLSDVEGYAEMPSSGMILSVLERFSSLWDGNFVKLEVGEVIQQASSGSDYGCEARGYVMIVFELLSFRISPPFRISP